ncbi:hypothetical protein [Pseudomonas sp.]|uniref:hypothetical protein n=1 Tax=Pseudomonas sp. TaxID=306 RepID=UPI003FD71E82
MSDYKQAEFEKHATEDLKVSVEKDSSGEYINPATVDCWDAWKAGRKAIWDIPVATGEGLDRIIEQRARGEA